MVPAPFIILFPYKLKWKFYKNLALVGDGDIPQDQLISIPAAEWVEGYYYTDPKYETPVPMETLFGDRANQDVFFPRVSLNFQIQIYIK